MRSNSNPLLKLSDYDTARCRVEAEPIIQSAAAAFCVPPETVTGDGRPGPVVMARMAAMAKLLETIPQHTVAAIFNRTDGAVSYLMRKHAEAMQHDQFYQGRVARMNETEKGGRK